MISLNQIIEKQAAVKVIVHIDTLIERIIQINSANTDANAIFWCSDKNLHLLQQLKCGTVICSEKGIENTVNNNINYILVKNPRAYFRDLLMNFFYQPNKQTGVASSASVHPSVKFGKDVFVGHNVVIEENCEIGSETRINHNTVILAGTKIGNNVSIGSNNTIGGIGFGYEKNESGSFVLMPHIGNVLIEDNVEIGNNTCIDRGVLGSTWLKKNAKIDNLVHIAHGVVVGENTLVIANAMIGGSTLIGDNVWVAPSASLINNISIGNNSLVGLGSVVVKSIPEGTVVLGNPAKPKL